MPTYLRKQPIPNQYLKQQEAIDFVRGKGTVDLGVVHFNPTFKDPPPKQLDFGFLKREIPKAGKELLPVNYEVEIEKFVAFVEKKGLKLKTF